MIRITADLDFKNKWKVGYYLMKAIIIIKQIKQINITPSFKKGYHIEVWTTYPYTLKQHYHIRNKIGDDKARIKMDKLRKIGRNTLFNTKVNLKS